MFEYFVINGNARGWSNEKIILNFTYHKNKVEEKDEEFDERRSTPHFASLLFKSNWKVLSNDLNFQKRKKEKFQFLERSTTTSC